jgi:hypothetical protein
MVSYSRCSVLTFRLGSPCSSCLGIKSQLANKERNTTDFVTDSLCVREDITALLRIDAGHAISEPNQSQPMRISGTTKSNNDNIQ